jgi:hypothetical protein
MVYASPPKDYKPPGGFLLSLDAPFSISYDSINSWTKQKQILKWAFTDVLQ